MAFNRAHHIPRLWRAICVVLLAGAGKFQTSAQTDITPRFEVASVKRCTERGFDDFGGTGRGRAAATSIAVDPARISIECRTVESLVVQAYVLFSDGQGRSMRAVTGEPFVQGGPAWIKSDLYTIDAKTEGIQTSAMMRGPMLQTLLEDRFKLKVHREVREVPGYALVVGKGGATLQPTKEGTCTPVDLTQSPRPPLAPGQPPPCGSARGGSDGLLHAQGWSMADLCRALSARLNQKVVDKTGITGLFDIQFALWAGNTAIDDSDPGGPDPAGGLRDAVQKLGLRLESARSTAEFVFIDHIERPTEN
jgi:uncharacterized protein (TIGR03435 family)